jgi:D-threonine aldolase
MSMKKYEVKHINEIDSPAILLYRSVMEANIDAAIAMVHDKAMFRPHVKTNKMREVCEYMLGRNITSFKTATIAESEMLASIGAKDVLLAYQPCGPKTERLARLIKAYPATKFSCLVDNADNATAVSSEMHKQGINELEVYIDVNVGMNRTGVPPGKIKSLYETVVKLKHIKVAGFHIYDGHIRETDIDKRTAAVNAAFEQAEPAITEVENEHGNKFSIVAGGSPSFSVHLQRQGTQCSPGTFVFWDWKYKQMFPDLPFDYALLVVTRVVSVISKNLICLDLGNKSVACESPFPRVMFFDIPEAESISQNEEHFVIRVTDSGKYSVGDVIYGVPLHVCPTVALHQHAYVIENNLFTQKWQVASRNRAITI